MAAEPDDVATRIANRTLARRAPDYPAEVRRLLDAGREVMRRGGTSSRPRVADIVAEAGLSNDAFYRHFASKDALVAAILEDGTERLTQLPAPPDGQGVHARGAGAALGHRACCPRAPTPSIAAATLAVLWNAGGLVPGRRPLRPVGQRAPGRAAAGAVQPSSAARCPSSTRRSPATPWWGG